MITGRSELVPDGKAAAILAASTNVWESQTCVEWRGTVRRAMIYSSGDDLAIVSAAR
jgi:hypothetical protein